MMLRVPCRTPTAPVANRAACRPATMASPPASTPISRTSASSTNPSKMPRALLPPPTQATTAAGNRPVSSTIWCRASRPMTDWNSLTISG